MTPTPTPGLRCVEVKAEWPDKCSVCQKMFESNEIDSAVLVASIRKLQEQVVQDIESGAKPTSAALKRLKDARDTPDKPSGQAEGTQEGASKVKEERPCVKQERVKQEPVSDPENVAETVAQNVAEELMSKEELMKLHNLFKKPTQDDKHAVYCEHCRKSVQGRNRAKIWQHCRGQEHRAKWKGKSLVKTEVEEMDALTHSLSIGQCPGLKLSEPWGQKTRLGTDLLPVWKEYTTFADLQASHPFAGSCHEFEYHCTSDDWTLRHCRCQRENAKVRVDEEGNRICSLCLALGSEKRFLSKIASFVADLDQARLLFARMFAAETVESVVEQFQSKANYMFRCQTTYDRFIALPVDELWQKVRAIWCGRAAHKMTEACKMFHLHTVRPCLDCEPGHCLKEKYLQQLVNYMQNDPNSSEKDLELVKQVVTGKLSRHPALHGVMVACALKVDHLERGITTMRNRHSAFAGNLAACSRSKMNSSEPLRIKDCTGHQEHYFRP